MLDKLIPIFQNIFNDSDLIINSATSSNDIEGWDSFAHIRLIVAIETELNIRFSSEDIASLENVGQIVKLIKKITKK